ncbi:enoyl-CoA hydratase-related protein [Dactylosporangium sp. AC04546]|uniref:enoyl-CoA hydratase/isomerase family protein n=1 Tax=Dactylosporangium sp. AC04546 TaxID=2862460 RepID=UPI001EDF7AF4|nr:enoyl-CoA hydratase-related protein [Dactylosporangium sp. AC04546]WVK87267.1 enoyl-CoA hydratase-related protein [Dactylosporangium sp. AC04546]
MTGGDVLVERHDGVLLVRLNRPQRHNAIGGTMLRDLAAAFDEAGRDDAVRVVVTIGVGAAFCVGADVADFDRVRHLPARELLVSDLIGGEKGLPARSPADVPAEELGNAGRWALRMWALEKPTIAAVNGAAVGGGFGIALLHDIRLAASTARLGTGFAAAGLAPELGISHLLPRVAGYAAAAELLLTGRLVDAAEARELQLVSGVVPDEELLERAMELAGRIASGPPLGARLTKRLLRRSAAAELEAQLRAEYTAQVTLFDHPETRAAMDRLAQRVMRRRD